MGKWFIVMSLPGLALLAVGVVLLLRQNRLWGKRLLYAGMGLMYLLPAALVAVAVFTGEANAAALIFPILTAPFGIGIFYGLRYRWADPN